MTFDEWWNTQVLERIMKKDSKRYGVSYIRLLAENAWLASAQNKTEEDLGAQKKNRILSDIGPEVSIPPPPAGELDKDN